MCFVLIYDVELTCRLPNGSIKYDTDLCKLLQSVSVNVNKLELLCITENREKRKRVKY